jgi:hypothetical protein
VSHATVHEAQMPWKNLPEHIGGQQHSKIYHLTDGTRNKHAYLPFSLDNDEQGFA